jgi:Leu/Phe-tRNA-protein transferase
MVLLQPGMDYNQVVDTLIQQNYSDEFCIALSFDKQFIQQLMRSGFLIMSFQDKNRSLLTPKLHLERSVLFFQNLHIPKSVKSRLSQYTLKPFDTLQPIIKACVEAHGDDWLTPPLQEVLYHLEWKCSPYGKAVYLPREPFCSAFGLYRDSVLVAGEFGIFCGGVYTSYSGFYRESNSGNVQMILTAQYLENIGYAFWDLGMPLEYKERLGAEPLNRRYFINLFRQARLLRPALEL